MEYSPWKTAERFRTLVLEQRGCRKFRLRVPCLEQCCLLSAPSSFLLLALSVVSHKRISLKTPS